MRTEDLHVTRLLWMFAALSVVFLGVLAVAPAKSHFTEWREHQQAYNAAAAAMGIETFRPAIQQIWNPKLGVVDRCTSCHLGMGAAEPVAKGTLFRGHPKVPHDIEAFGCTVCHGGQGRATTKAAAHGLTRHWDEPLLSRRHFESGCGACHSYLPVPSEEADWRGSALFARYDCIACHRVDGRGRGKGPDLSAAGLRGFAPDWNLRHLAQQSRATGREGKLWRASFGPIRDGDRATLDAFLWSRSGAPKLLEGKALAHRLGCRGCHRVNGVGGDDGPDLTNVGRKAASDLDYSGVRGAHTLEAWLVEHFLDPQRIVKGSRMPDLGLARADAESLAGYMLSLRALEVPEAYWPKDRIRGARLGEREFSTDGESLFGVFCAGCHGPRGEGRRYGSLDVVFPAIGGRAFLSIASDDYLRRTITHGRPGRRMPAWGEKDGGLRGTEIDAIVSYLRSLAPGTPDALEPVPPGEPSRGAALFARSCAGCHGLRGEGKEAPGIGREGFLSAASDSYIAATILRGRQGTSMRHFGQPTLGFETLTAEEVRDIISYLRSLEPARKQGSPS